MKEINIKSINDIYKFIKENNLQNQVLVEINTEYDFVKESYNFKFSFNVILYPNTTQEQVISNYYNFLKNGDPNGTDFFDTYEEAESSLIKVFEKIKDKLLDPESLKNYKVHQDIIISETINDLFGYKLNIGTPQNKLFHRMFNAINECVKEQRKTLSL